MQVLIHSRIATTDDELRTRITKALDAALAPVRACVDRFDAYLTDVNGPRGGPDKRCRVVAHLPNGPVVVSRTGLDPVAAISAAAVRCRHLILARLKRRRDRGRQAPSA